MLTVMPTYFRRIPEYIKRYVYIDESIPQLLRWKKVLSNRIKVGDPVGCHHYAHSGKKGHYFMFRFNKKAYLNHRVYYFLKTGKDPGKATNEHPKGAVVSPGIWNTEKDFWNLVDVKGPDECWLWKGTVAQVTGYGKWTWRNTTCNAHRLAYIFRKGLVPPKLQVCHDRKCVSRLCCNPRHLRADTAKANAADRMAVGNQVYPKGEINGKSKLTTEQVLQIHEYLRTKAKKQKDIAVEFGVCKSTITHIKQGKLWPHLHPSHST